MTAPAVTRIPSFFYDTFEVGGSTAYHLTGVPRFEIEGGSVCRGMMAYQVVVQEATDAAFKTACAALETAYRKRNVRVRLVMTGATTETNPDWDPAAASGFNSVAIATVVGTPGGDTRYSRVYDVVIRVELPTPDSSGLLDVNVGVSWDASVIRTVAIRGVYRADPGPPVRGATDQFTNQIEAVCTSILTTLTGNYERIGQTTDRDRVDKNIAFTRTYLELVANQSTATLDVPAIVKHTIAVERLWPQPGDSGAGVKRLEEFSVKFSCNVDKTVTTDIDGLWTGTILPYLKAVFVAHASPKQYGIVAQQYSMAPQQSVLQAELRILAAINPTDVIESAITSRLLEHAGLEYTGALTGGIFDAWVDQGVGQRLRFTRRVQRVLGSLSPKSRIGGGGTFEGVSFGNGGVGTESPASGGAPGNDEGSGGSINAGLQPSGGSSAKKSGWNLIDNDSRVTNRTIGQPGGPQMAGCDLEEDIVERWNDEPPSGGGGGGLNIGLSPGPGGSYAGADIQGA